MSVVELLPAQRHAKETRNKLRNPPDAVPDTGITMKNGRAVNVIPIKRPEPELPADCERPTAIDETLVVEVLHPVNIPPQNCRPYFVASEFPSLALIFDEVCSFYRMSKADLVSKRRTFALIKPRHVAIYLGRTLTPCSLPLIGRNLGDRDHTTVLHAHRKMEAKIAADARLADEVELITIKIKERHTGVQYEGV